MARDPYGELRSRALATLQEAVHSLRGDADVDLDALELAAAPAGKGDWAFACFPLASILRKSPVEIARDLADAMPPMEGVTWSPEGPYLNAAVDPLVLVRETVEAVEEDPENFGHLDRNGVRVIVEHTSANPNGPFHVGRARNPIVGDTTARILAAAGYDVLTEYYVNDVGKQVAILAWGLENLAKGDVAEAEREKVDHELVPYYQAANKRMEEDPEVAAAINGSLKAFEEGDEDVAFRFHEAASRVLEGMRASLARMNVHVKNYKWESEFLRDGSVDDVVMRLKALDEAHEDEDGSWYLDLEAFGIAGRSSRWTFTRRDGTSLYTTRDVAYHLDKFARADRLVNVLGEDHKLTMQQLGIALNLLGVDRGIEVLFYSFVSLPEGKMSTRRGRVVFVDDLLDEAVERARAEVEKRRGAELTAEEMDRIAELVGIGALRFNIVSVQPEKGIKFRWEEALNFDGATAPFVQYAHARAASILGKVPAGGKGEPGHLITPSEVALVRAIARLPGVVADAAARFRPHLVAAYAVELAGAFNDFYRDCPVATAEAPIRDARLMLVRSAKATLANTLDLLGVAAPESM